MDASLVKEVEHVLTNTANMMSHDDFMSLWRAIGTLFWPVLRIMGKNPESFVQGVRWRYSQWLSPDHACTWILPALWCGIRVVRRQRPRVIYATAPPFSSLVIGALLSKLTRLPLIADFRDLWMSNFDRRPVANFRKWTDPRLERLCVSQASKIITTTHLSGQTLCANYPDIPKERFCTIYNGFDSADFPNPGNTLAVRDYMLICHVGSLYGKQTPEPFLKALDLAFQEYPDMHHNLRVRFVGKVEQFQSLLQDRQSNVFVEATGPLPHQQAIENLLSADVLLLIIGIGGEVVVPGKIFEYFAARKPIIACAPTEGEAASLLRSHGSCTIVNHSDVEKIKNAIVCHYQRWSKGDGDTKVFSDAFINQFERRELTRQLVKLFNEYA